MMAFSSPPARAQERALAGHCIYNFKPENLQNKLRTTGVSSEPALEPPSQPRAPKSTPSLWPHWVPAVCGPSARLPPGSVSDIGWQALPPLNTLVLKSLLPPGLCSLLQGCPSLLPSPLFASLGTKQGGGGQRAG